MDGSSRGALLTSRNALEQALAQGSTADLAEELFFVGRTLDGSAALRRSLSDPSRPAVSRQGLVDRLFEGKVSDTAREIVRKATGQRWSAERDMADAIDLLGAEAVLAHAESEGRIEQVEHDLFILGQAVRDSPTLRDALADRRRSGEDKSALVSKLLEGKATPEAQRLAALAAHNPRGQRFDQAVQRYADVAARRREQLVAIVTSARALADDDAQRLTQVLSKNYGKQVQLNVLVDPELVGGLRVQIGDDIIDGSVSGRLEEARRAMAG
ncbi:F0F1 ATP synthase subunit delta [Demetria terragena]|uniref:F0F1 ATP synthase subunit delta n=1 Tax=Demetria terragena TaxID=63959 RepID=UPI0003817AA9|nr:F0F1 ATP synthase subunit delta [Demetria terragena]